MKKPALIAIGLATAAIVSPSLADNTDTQTSTVSGTIVQALTLAVTNNITMPHVVRPVGAEATAQVKLICGAVSDAGNTVIYVPNSNPFAHGTPNASAVSALSANVGAPGANSTGTCANLTVTGDSNYYFVASIGSITQPTATGVTISGVECTFPDSTTFQQGGITSQARLSGGSATIRCGGTVRATTATTATSYNDGAFAVTVTYD